jgi:hypothetical protein
MKLLWHYTGPCIGDIFRSGYVDVARLRVVPPEKTVAWFSADQFWERTVIKTVPFMSMQEMLRAAIKLDRISGLPEAAPLNWTAIRKPSGLSSRTANVWGARFQDKPIRGCSDFCFQLPTKECSNG